MLEFVRVRLNATPHARAVLARLDGTPYYVERSPDGRSVLYSPPGGGLAIRPLAGGKAHLLTPSNVDIDPYPLGSGTARARFSYPYASPPGLFSPDGSKLVFTGFVVRDCHPCQPTVYMTNADGRGLHVLAGSGEYAFWSPDGRRLVYLDGAIGAGEGPFGGPSPVTVVTADGRVRTRIGEGGYAVWSPRGDLIVFHGTRTCPTLCVASPDGKRRRSVGPRGAAFPLWSPDGSMIAFSNVSGCCLGVMRADGTGLLQMTPPENYDRPVAWSPDGSRLALIHATPKIQAMLRIVDFRTLRSERIDSATAFADVRWARDGKSISYARFVIPSR
jgi:Tol biopolymer transport system component